MESDQGRDSNHQSAGKKPAAIEQRDSGHHGEIAQNQASISEQAFVDRIKRSDRWMILLTAAIALSGVASAIILGKQFRAMNGQLEVMRGQLAEMKSSGEQTERAITATNRLADEAAISAAESRRLADQAEQSAIATRKLAEAANKSAIETQRLAQEASRANAISQQALFGVQRPFMFTHGTTIEDVKVFMGPARERILAGWRAYIKWENSGNTPTKGLTITTHCVLSVNPIADPFALLITAPKSTHMSTQSFSTVFGPKQIDVGGQCPIDLMSVALGKLLNFGHYYAFGTAYYKDILNGTKTYRTDFCYELTLAGGPLAQEFEGVKNPEPVHLVSGHCFIHNCADDECERQDKITAQNAAKSPPDLGFPPLPQSK